MTIDVAKLSEMIGKKLVASPEMPMDVRELLMGARAALDERASAPSSGSRIVVGSGVVDAAISSVIANALRRVADELEGKV